MIFPLNNYSQHTIDVQGREDVARLEEELKVLERRVDDLTEQFKFLLSVLSETHDTL